MRCVVAMMQHETNTFSSLLTPIDAFASGVGLALPPTGEQATELYGHADFAFAGLLDVAKQHNADITIPIAAYAEPSGFVNDDAFEFISRAICDAVAQGCDALLLDLHGAMVTQSYDDGEGELLQRVRQIAPDLPIAVALDFHTNLTAKMVRNCTVIDGYRTYPHIDMYQTGQRAARSLFKLLDTGGAYRLCWGTLPMMSHLIMQTPLRQPMKDIMDTAIAAVDSGNVMNASIFGGFPLADIPHVSLAVLTVEPASSENGSSLVNKLCEMAWQRRADFIYMPEESKDSIAWANECEEFPVVIADHGDNCGAGGNGDDLTVLDQMVTAGMSGIVAGPIWDPAAVSILVKAGIGATISLNVGGNTSVPAVGHVGCSMTVTGEVTAITDGRFGITGSMQTGLIVNLGRTAVISNDILQLVVCEQRWEPYDPGCFTHAGIDLNQQRFILLKSRQHFRAGFDSIARHIVLAAGPGICSSDYSQFGFKHLNRPIYPLDNEVRVAPHTRTHQHITEYCDAR